jgi:hypothetical protein
MATGNAEASRRWRSRNPDRVKALNDARDRDKLNALSRDYYRRNAETLRPAARQRRRENYHKDPETEVARSVTYRKNNLAKVNTRLRCWRKDKLATDFVFKLSVNLRRRVSHAIRRGSAVRDLGCSVTELKAWLEGQFVSGMTWENYGPVWHVDHKEPLAAFDLTDPVQFKQACHYTNLQPMFALENYRKGAHRYRVYLVE